MNIRQKNRHSYLFNVYFCKIQLQWNRHTLVEPTHYRLICEIATLQWRHNERDDVSNHQPHDRLLNRSFRRRSKKTSKLRVTGLCAGNSPVTGEFLAQRTSDAENFDDIVKYLEEQYHSGEANKQTEEPTLCNENNRRPMIAKCNMLN